ncbi:MAG: ATP-dependent sacrificial sulfur transferase LarE [Thermoleophilia bacterium]
MAHIEEHTTGVTPADGLSPVAAAAPPAEHAAAWRRLQELLRDLGGVVVAFSGGVDSAFLLAASRIALGDRVLAVTALSETYPREEAEGAVQLAESMGVAHRFVVSEELDLPEFKTNPRNRCYFCKKELFTKLLEVAHREGFACVCDGSNLDDLRDHRPGSQAAAELFVRSPLRDAGLGKEEIRALSLWLDLPTWNKPSFACLSSRFPYGTAITRERVGRVGRAESELRALGFTQLRLRYHGEVGRLEVLPEDFDRLLARGIVDQIIGILKGAGFAYATLDLQGYRTGSMNEAGVVPVLAPALGGVR